MKNYTLAEQHIYLVNRQRDVMLRKNFNNPRLNANDLTDTGYMALLKACELYDDSMGIPFEHYAARTIHRAMIKHITTNASSNIVSLDEGFLPERTCCDWRYEDEYMLELLKEAMDTLTPSERQLVESRFGFDKNPMKLKELASMLGVTFQAVDRRLQRIFAKLRRYLDENRYTYNNCA